MRYVGGKSKIAGKIVDTIRELSPGATTAIEPFMGGGARSARTAMPGSIEEATSKGRM